MTTTPAIDFAAVHTWLRTAARPVAATDPDHQGRDLEPLVERLAGASVVGIGESTRFSRQTYGVRDRLFRALVTRHGFRTLAIQDSVSSGERLDAHVRGDAGDARSVLAAAWRPWRTAETVATLDWIRRYNLAHPDDPVRITGVEPVSAGQDDYDAVLDHVRRSAPGRYAELEAQLSPIRTAHRMDEHVQRHRGVHPGRPFAEHARDALALLASLPRPTGPDAASAHDDALVRARRIVDFHRDSVAGRGGFGRDEHGAARTIIDRYEATGARTVYWDGISHTAGLPLDIGGESTERFTGEGSHLRARFGPGYLSVAIGFHHGDLGEAVAPAPAPGLIDATLGAVGLPAFYVDLRGDAPAEVERWRRAPVRARVISGVYDPARDSEARIRLASLAGAFDVLIQVRETTPVRWLPEFNAG